MRSVENGITLNDIDASTVSRTMLWPSANSPGVSSGTASNRTFSS